MRIIDTFSSDTFEPGPTVRIYLCGVTVYDEAHIGHARTVIVFDVLRRYLENRGHTVRMVQNFTDVDDKMIRRAHSEGTNTEEIGRRHITGYHRDFDRLGVRRADAYPQATEHIEDMIRLIDDLIGKGYAYAGRRGVYFDVSEFERYGILSGKKTDQLRAGARVDVDPDKHDPLDFALWKFADSEPRWESPWGAGRPGWHIECSAMSPVRGVHRSAVC